MSNLYFKYNVTPRVLLADKPQTVSVVGLDHSMPLYDDNEYIVTLIACDMWEYNEGKVLREINCSKEFRLRPVNGVLSFQDDFHGEHEWKVKIEQVENTHVPETMLKYHPKNAANYKLSLEFSLYSLREDLFRLRPYKGDIHIHTTGSDGSESPEITAAQYRKYGFDYIAVTDHHNMDSSLEAIEYYKNIDTALKLFPGEEIHPCGNLHMINFNSRYSVCALAREDADRNEREVLELSKEFDDTDSETAYALAWYKWVCDNIRKAGGVAIYPHPLWKPRGRVNIPLSTTLEILKRGLCDVYEVYGGTDRNNNRMQVQLSHQLASEGYKLPIVACSDSHDSLSHNYSRFDQAWTVTFAENAEEIPDAVKRGMSVAVDNFVPSDRNVYGDFRLVQYTWFLLENFYETHDELCNAAGQAIIRYVHGDRSQNTVISLLEKEIRAFSEGFFGNDGFTVDR